MRHENHHTYQIEGETMQTTCLLDHSLEGTIPRGLCRACHPEFNARAAPPAELNASEAPRSAAEEAAHWRQLSFEAAIAA
jgi:hypothetical protein